MGVLVFSVFLKCFLYVFGQDHRFLQMGNVFFFHAKKKLVKFM